MLLPHFIAFDTGISGDSKICADTNVVWTYQFNYVIIMIEKILERGPRLIAYKLVETGNTHHPAFCYKCFYLFVRFVSWVFAQRHTICMRKDDG